METVKAIQITEFGGPEAMDLVELDDPQPGQGETVVEITRAGVNFADTHATRDEYLAAQHLPLIPGVEFVGRTPEGKRVVGVAGSGGYAERIAVPVASLVPVPDEVDDDQAVALLIQGLTADAILGISARLEVGESVVVNAAAGGTGSLAVQIARSMGAGRIIGLASSDEKRSLVLDLGADDALDSSPEGLAERVLEANGGEVDIVLEMAGGDAFDELVSTLAPFGRMITFGIATRQENTVRTGSLMRYSRAIVGFWFTHMLSRPDLVRGGLERVLGAASAGDLRAVVGGVYPLSRAAEAHEALVGRRTTGKLLLDPAS
jgi:NADPH:quinone reductase